MYGKNCRNICKCRNNSLCDHKSGFCRCASGWIGELYVESIRDTFYKINFVILVSNFSCEKPCPLGQYGMMCHKKCQCNDGKCDPQSGECLSQNAKIVFDVSHNRSASIMKLSSDRIKAKHWIPLSGNGKIIFRNCSDSDRCEFNNDNKKTLNKSASVDQSGINKTAIIQEINANLSNLTKELVEDSDKSVVVVNSSIAIHHIHKGITGSAGTKHTLKDLLTPSTEIIIETENQDIINDHHSEFDGVDVDIDHNQELDDSDVIDSIGGYNDIVHVFAVSSINTTKSVRQRILWDFLPKSFLLVSQLLYELR